MIYLSPRIESPFLTENQSGTDGSGYGFTSSFIIVKFVNFFNNYL